MCLLECLLRTGNHRHYSRRLSTYWSILRRFEVILKAKKDRDQTWEDSSQEASSQEGSTQEDSKSRRLTMPSEELRRLKDMSSQHISECWLSIYED